MISACTSKLSSLQSLTLKSCCLDGCIDTQVDGCMKGHTDTHYSHTCFSIHLARSFWYGSYIEKHLKILIAMKNCTLLKWVINCNEWFNDLFKNFSLYLHFYLNNLVRIDLETIASTLLHAPIHELKLKIYFKDCLH